MPPHPRLTVKEIETIRESLRKGATTRMAAENHGRSLSVVTRINNEKQYARMLALAKEYEGAGKRNFSQTANRTESNRRRNRILKLHSKGLPIKQIAKRIGISHGTVGYYLKTSQPQEGAFNASRNGNSNGNFKTETLVGIAYAETERFITLLGERIGLAPKILRSRLCELLGHTPIRSASRDSDPMRAMRMEAASAESE